MSPESPAPSAPASLPVSGIALASVLSETPRAPRAPLTFKSTEVTGQATGAVEETEIKLARVLAPT